MAMFTLVKKYTNKIFDLLADDNDDAVEMLINEGKAERLPSKDFRDEFRKDLQSDLDILKEIHQLWTDVNRDPKLLSFIDKLSANPILKRISLLSFTESKETAEYLAKILTPNSRARHFALPVVPVRLSGNRLLKTLMPGLDFLKMTTGFSSVPKF